LWRKELDDLGAFAKEFGAKGLAYLLVEAAGSGDPAVQTVQSGDLQVRGPIAKFLTPQELAAILSATEAQAGDMVAFVADQAKTVANVLGRLRNEIATRLKLADPN